MDYISKQTRINRLWSSLYSRTTKSNTNSKSKDDILRDTLMEQTDSLPLYKLEGKFECKVVDVYDGDTCTIVLINKGGFEKHKLRMYGYDSPEMKPLLKLPNRDEIKENAIIARNFFSDFVNNKLCIFESMGTDKYGRLLGILWCDGVNVNELMLNNGYGYAYEGGKKM